MFRERARQLGLPFVPAVDVPVMPAPSLDALALGAFARARDPDGPAFIAPDRTLLARTRGWLAAHPEAVPQLQVTTPTAIRAALRDADADTFAAAAVTRLEAVDPRLSARRVATIAEIAAGVILAGGIGFGLSHWPVVTLLAINLFAGAFFFGVTVLRFLAAHLVPARLPVTAVADLPGEVPVYSVLVPLRDEAAIVPQLVAALDRLAWPEDRLDIKLIVESDDAATRQAVEIATRGPPYEIVVVPAGLPRTKPKALAYALTFARGSFVTVYDAEDRPDPRQLAEAWQTFSRSDPRLACLQAPIVIRNQRESLLARSFAVEYSALFDGLLPALAALRMPLPLGGTSNHFRGVR